MRLAAFALILVLLNTHGLAQNSAVDRAAELLGQVAANRADAKGSVPRPTWVKLLEAADLIQSVRKSNTDPALSGLIEGQARKLKQELTTATMANIRDLGAQGDTSLANHLFRTTEKATRHLIGLDSAFYLAYDYLGQVLANKGDSTSALGIYRLGLGHYQRGTRGEPDFNAYNMVYRAAVLELKALKDVSRSEATLTHGLSLLDKDQSIAETSKSMTDLRRKMVIDKIAKSRNDLGKFRLDVLMEKPELSAAEMMLFIKAMEENPKDINIRLAYGKALSKRDPEEAIKYYEQLFNEAQNDFIVVYSLAAMYSEKADRLAKEPGKEKEMSKYMVKALKAFELAEYIEPQNKQLLHTLAVINGRLGHRRKSEYYFSRL